MHPESHVLYSLHNAPLKLWPFPHFFATDVFPLDFYTKIQTFLHEDHEYKSTDYLNRKFAENNDIPGLEFMKDPKFLQHIVNLFKEQANEQLGEGKIQLYRDLRLIRDSKEYKIGPHTDAQWKIISLLFYLPPDDRYREYGTSFFLPKDPTFRCRGGPHHAFQPFNKCFTAPFIPNSCLGFWKTDHSFHGVEPIPIEIKRDILLYNVYRAKPPEKGE